MQLELKNLDSFTLKIHNSSSVRHWFILIRVYTFKLNSQNFYCLIYAIFRAPLMNSISADTLLSVWNKLNEFTVSADKLILFLKVSNTRIKKVHYYTCSSFFDEFYMFFSQLANQNVIFFKDHLFTYYIFIKIIKLSLF